jgi:hypothetical protein
MASNMDRQSAGVWNEEEIHDTRVTAFEDLN